MTGIARTTRMSAKRKLAIILFAVYISFILISTIPYLAEQDASRGSISQGQYESHLVFPEDGAYGHYTIVVLANKELPGKIDLKYTYATNTLTIQKIENIKELVIDCELMYQNKCKEVFGIDPDKLENADMFEENDGLFTVNINSDTPMDKLKFIGTPLPKRVSVNNMDWWKTETQYYSVDGDDVTIRNIPEGTTTVKVYFELIGNSPTALFSASKYVALSNDEITFDASGSTDEDGEIEHYIWDFGDDTEISGLVVKHSYSELGSYTVILTVRDNDYLEDVYSKTISIVEADTDSDNDGVLDISDPNPEINIDTDGDGLSDDYEDVISLTDKTKTDSDNDGWDDKTELAEGTDPTDPTSHPPEPNDPPSVTLITNKPKVKIGNTLTIEGEATDDGKPTGSVLTVTVKITKGSLVLLSEQPVTVSDVDGSFKYDYDIPKSVADDSTAGLWTITVTVSDGDKNSLDTTPLSVLAVETDDDEEKDTSMLGFGKVGGLDIFLLLIIIVIIILILLFLLLRRKKPTDEEEKEEVKPGWVEEKSPQVLEGVTEKMTYPCPTCGAQITKNQPACDKCGAAINWGGEQQAVDETQMEESGTGDYYTTPPEPPVGLEPTTGAVIGERGAPEIEMGPEPDGAFVEESLEGGVLEHEIELFECECGATIDSDTQICPGCGAELEFETPEEEHEIPGEEPEASEETIENEESVATEENLEASREIPDEELTDEIEEIDVTIDEPGDELPIENIEFTVRDYVKEGATQFKNKNYSDAIIAWQKALDLEPDHPEIVESIQAAMERLKSGE